MTVTINNVSSTVQHVEAANKDLHRLLAEVSAMFDTLRQFKLFNPDDETEKSNSNEISKGTKPLLRSISQLQDTTEDGEKSVEEFNDRLTKRLDAYKQTMTDLRSHVSAINRDCPSEWLDQKSYVTITRVSDLNAEEKIEYDRLEVERNRLRKELEKRNAHLTQGIQQLRDMSSAMALCSNVRQL
eukprot:CFRG6806T1